MFLGNTRTGINWESDSHLYVKRDLLPTETRVTSSGVTLPDVDDPDFINWMRPAGFNRFRKLYRIIHEPIDANTKLIFTVNNGSLICCFSYICFSHLFQWNNHIDVWNK
jgi:hypothetical protein